MSKLWIVGCSISHGIGVDTDQRWGHILSQQLDLVPTFLTAEGSSIEWAADQILQANIQQNDFVCWGLTTPNRSLWYNDLGEPQHVLNVYYQTRPEFQHTLDQRHLVESNLAYKAVNYVKQVQNYLDKIKCQYVIGSMLPGLEQHQKIILQHLETNSNFCVMYNFERVKFVDLATFFSISKPVYNLFEDTGSDQFHPGPKQHKLYAEQFLKCLHKQKL